ncbi:universal stress protein [Seongchinamella sediminis]|uniref:Universal stress protein n=1 Tax=Seongchinamella sediminis TaxID=2283635 RepID=A0A3L7E233_9GAMM|nr:universal stress protein [Seongchinamella sediminis]RLQ23049.1 universal stress protein [Seongchinamella sediminis]
MGKILVIADQKDSAIATGRGLELAARLGHSVDVYAFTYVPLGQLEMPAPERTALKRRLLQDRKAEVQARIDKLARDGQKVRLKVLWQKDVANWIADHCRKTDYEMVVKTGHRSETLARASTDWQLLRECNTPILVVAEKKWRRTQPVLAALDLSSRIASKKKLNATILAHAAALAEAMDEELHIISAVEIPTLLDDLDLIDTRSYVRKAKAEMEPHIKALARQFKLPVNAFVVKRGPVEKVIASEAAKRRAQIVVMGTVGRKGIKAKLLGNTAERVLEHLKTDVLALKP